MVVTFTIHTGMGHSSSQPASAQHDDIVQKVHADAKAEGLILRSNAKNSSGYTGVRVRPQFELADAKGSDTLGFEAFYSPNPLVHHQLGYFRTPEEAALAVARAEKRAHPERQSFVDRSWASSTLLS